jgi:hypothetical protein
MWTVNLDICAGQDIFPSCYTDLAEVRQNFDAHKNVEENAGRSAVEHLAQSNGISFNFIWLWETYSIYDLNRLQAAEVLKEVCYYQKLSSEFPKDQGWWNEASVKSWPLKTKNLTSGDDWGFRKK